MKTNAIVRIVCYSLIALLLIGILLTVLGIGTFQFQFGDSGNYITGEGAVAASEIQNLEIEWVSGNVNIQIATDGSDKICFSESGYAEEDRRMVWEQRGTTLVIHYSEPGFSIGFVSTPDKDLTVTDPAEWYCEKLDISTVSGSVDVTLLSASTIQLESVSAQCLFESCTARDVTLTTVSGNLEYRGEVDELECEAVSAECTILPNNVPKKLSLDAVSGDLIVGIFEDVGFTASIDSVSGNIYSDFNTTNDGGKQVYGDGSCQIEAETVSGDIQIKRVARAVSICNHIWDDGMLMGYPAGNEEWSFTCSLCGDTNTETRAHTHSWDEGTVQTVPGTDQLQKVYSCALCGATRAENITPTYTVSCVNDFTQDMVLIPLSGSYPTGTPLTVTTDVLTDVDLALYVNGEFVCYQTAVENAGQYHWEFYFTMPAANVTIQLKTRDGLSDSEGYMQAMALKDMGKIGEAAIAFAKLDGFMDARQQSFALWRALFPAETISTSSLCMAAVRSDGTVITSGPMWQEDYPQRPAEEWTGIVSVSCGPMHILGIREDGTVVAAGDNSQGQCNVSAWRDIVQIRAGDGFSLGLTADGTVVCAGAVPESVADWTSVVALECADNHVIGLRFDGTVLAAGGDEWGECAVADVENVIDIYTDDVRTTLLCADGSIANLGQDDYLDVEHYPGLASYGVCAGCYYGTMTDGTVVCLLADETADVSAWQDTAAFVNYCGRLFGLQEDGSLLVLYAFSEAQGPVPDWTELMVP